MVTMWAPVSTTSQGACVVTHPAYFWVPGVIVIESHKGWVGRPDAMINVGWVIKEHIMRIRVEVMMIRRCFVIVGRMWHIHVCVRVVAILAMEVVWKKIVVAVEVCAFNKLREELLPVLLWSGLVWVPDITSCENRPSICILVRSDSIKVMHSPVVLLHLIGSSVDGVRVESSKGASWHHRSAIRIFVVRNPVHIVGTPVIWFLSVVVIGCCDSEHKCCAECRFHFSIYYYYLINISYR